VLNNCCASAASSLHWLNEETEMANAIYPIFKTALMTAAANVSLNVNTSVDGPYVSIIDTNAVAFSNAHDFYDDVLAANVGTSQNITNPTVGSVSQGTFHGTNVTFTAVTGAQSEALIIYRHNSGANTTWRLVCYLDTNVTGLPVTPNGGDIVVAWNASGIFTL
jgi:hypothetical protein